MHYKLASDGGGNGSASPQFRPKSKMILRCWSGSSWNGIVEPLHPFFKHYPTQNRYALLLEMLWSRQSSIR